MREKEKDKEISEGQHTGIVTGAQTRSTQRAAGQHQEFLHVCAHTDVRENMPLSMSSSLNTIRSFNALIVTSLEKILSSRKKNTLIQTMN